MVWILNKLMMNKYSVLKIKKNSQQNNLKYWEFLVKEALVLLTQ